jgi:hypothetical protein
LNSIDVWIIAANSMGYIQNLIQVAVLLSTDRVKISRESWESWGSWGSWGSWERWGRWKS